MAQIILLKDVPKVGQRGEVKEVKDGFFRHFLFPQKLAEIATPAKIRKHEEELKLKREERGKKEKAGLEELVRLAETTLSFTSKTTEKGSLYKAITAKDIEVKLHELGFKNISKDWIKLQKPLKEVGEVSVEIEKPSGEKGLVKIEIKAS